MFAPSNVADSTSTVVVVAVTSEAPPPITPATATASSASAMTSISVDSVRSLPSINRNRSPALARRTTIRPPRSRSKSNACSGCPSSSIT